MADEPAIGLALGAGGANGLAHILMLEAFDELGVKPAKIAGSSVGAVIGALYASGRTAVEIGGLVKELVLGDRDSWKDIFLNKEILQWVDFLAPEIGKGGLISGDAFLTFIYEHIRAEAFEDLTIPLAVVAADFWAGEQVVFESGELLSAIQGSMALPGVFSPVRREGSILIDGGTVNPVPHDILAGSCGLTVAVDVGGRRTQKDKLSFWDTLFNTFKIMQRSVAKAKEAADPPDIVVRPEIADIRVLEFYKAEAVFEQARPAKDDLKRQLEARLSKGGG